MTNRKIEYRVIPPEAGGDGDRAGHLREALRPAGSGAVPGRTAGAIDSRRRGCLWPQRKDRAKRINYEYERAGTAAILLFAEPLAGRLEVAVWERRTKVDRADEMARLLEERYATFAKVIVVCDNLNTHTAGAFYEAFEPERARALVRRIEFRYTPKHGSWLNVAENELSSMTRQCVTGRRLGDIETLREGTAAWSSDVNSTQRGVDWQMKIDDALCKLKSVYPTIKT